MNAIITVVGKDGKGIIAAVSAKKSTIKLMVLLLFCDVVYTVRLFNGLLMHC